MKRWLFGPILTMACGAQTLPDAPVPQKPAPMFAVLAGVNEKYSFMKGRYDTTFQLSLDYSVKRMRFGFIGGYNPATQDRTIALTSNIRLRSWGRRK